MDAKSSWGRLGPDIVESTGVIQPLTTKLLEAGAKKVVITAHQDAPIFCGVNNDKYTKDMDIVSMHPAQLSLPLARLFGNGIVEG